MKAFELDDHGQIGDRKTSVWIPRAKLEELWPGFSQVLSPCPEQIKTSSSMSSSVERMEFSLDSPLLLEDYTANLQSDHSFVYETDLRFNMKSPSLFNECNDHKTYTQPVDLQSPTFSTADSNDGLPISDDSWSLLEELDAISESKMAAPLTNCLLSTIINDGNYIPSDSPDDFADLPDFAQLDSLLTLDNDEILSIPSPATSLPSAALNDKLPTAEASTSDLLAELISHTFSTEPSLKGLLSCTTLDIRSVFGENPKTEANLEIPNEDLISATQECVQEVPEVKTEHAVKTRKRPATSGRTQPATTDQKQDEGLDISVSLDETKAKRQKRSGEEKYNEMRQKNNIASKRSRATRREKFQNLEVQAVQLEEDNKRLRARAELLEATVKKLKESLFSHILVLKNK